MSGKALKWRTCFPPILRSSTTLSSPMAAFGESELTASTKVFYLPNFALNLFDFLNHESLLSLKQVPLNKRSITDHFLFELSIRTRLLFQPIFLILFTICETSWIRAFSIATTISNRCTYTIKNIYNLYNKSRGTCTKLHQEEHVQNSAFKKRRKCHHTGIFGTICGMAALR